jgi:hypothetical protein
MSKINLIVCGSDSDACSFIVSQYEGPREDVVGKRLYIAWNSHHVSWVAYDLDDEEIDRIKSEIIRRGCTIGRLILCSSDYDQEKWDHFQSAMKTAFCSATTNLNIIAIHSGAVNARDCTNFDWNALSDIGEINKVSDQMKFR